MNIGKAVKELRKEKGFSQEELAKGIGISVTSLSQIETGAKKPSASSLEGICSFFGIPQPLLYILGTEESDVPHRKKVVYETLFPHIKEMILKITQTEV